MIPELFLERLKRIVPQDQLEAVVHSFSKPEIVSIRFNPLKSPSDEAEASLMAAGAILSKVPWYPHARIVEGMSAKDISHHVLTGQGIVYQQSLSSMIPAVILDPQPGEKVFDACAAPGSKTTQIAAMMGNEGQIVAVEAVKNRFFRLKSVCTLLGAELVQAKLCDMRRFRPSEGDLFDRVLVDAPCSSEGRFRADDPESVGYWSLRKIKEMSYKQKGILMSASRLVRPGGVLVYATCTFAPEENEEVVDWLMHKSENTFSLEEAGLTGIPRLPGVTVWGKSIYNPDIMKCLRVRPDNSYGGFFVAKLRRT